MTEPNMADSTDASKSPSEIDKPAQPKSEALLVSLGPDLEGFGDDDALGVAPQEWMNILNGYTKVGYWCVDVATGMVEWSPRTFQIHGLPYEPGPVAMTAAIKKYHPEDMPRLMSLIEQAIENECGFSFQLRLIDNAGAIKNVASVAAFKTTEDGKRFLYGIFHEVTPNHRGVPTLHSVAY